jgi:hypothetical protein
MHRYGLSLNARSATKFRFAVRLPQLPAEARTISNESFSVRQNLFGWLNVYRNNSAHHSPILLSVRIESVALSSLRIL